MKKEFIYEIKRLNQRYSHACKRRDDPLARILCFFLNIQKCKSKALTDFLLKAAYGDMGRFFPSFLSHSRRPVEKKKNKMATS